MIEESRRALGGVPVVIRRREMAATERRLVHPTQH
jgi:hypothetical protein